jgi:hypothetical protein
MPDKENFVFYGSWKESLDGLEGLCGKDVVKEVAWQIINLGTTKEMDTEDQNIINIVNGMCRDLIASAKKRHTASLENGRQGGRPPAYDQDAIRQMYKDGASIKIIADTLGCSTRTVQRALNAMSDEDEI